MDYKIVVPPLGESVVEGTIAKWLKKEGEAVKVDDPLVEIMTDKITVEIPCPYDGIMKKHLVKVDTVVEIGQDIAILEVEGEVETPEPEKPKDKVEETDEAIPQEQDLKEPPEEFTWITDHHQQMGIHADTEGIEGGIKAVKSSPVVRRLAREHFIDLRMVHGTGKDGRVTKDDVINYINSRHQVDKKTPDFAWPDLEKEEVIQITGVRKVIAEHMVNSAFTIPHVTTFDECDMSQLVAWRRQNVDKIEQEHGVRMTFLPFIAKAIVYAARDFPWVNATVLEGHIHVKQYFNIGMAVGRENSLIVPVVKHCEQKTILQIAKEMRDLADRANQDQLKVEEITGGTISITNPGPMGAINSTPIIAAPQVAILGVHKIVKRPVVVDDEVVIRPIMNMCLSFDHRVVDGAYAVQFLRKLIEYLEDLNSWIIGVT
jgi:2-oxoglutarate dehydrogenase complex dihydrolipoamide succinyltransferase (E2) component